MLRDIQLCSSRSVSCVQMQRFDNIPDTFTVHRQALAKWVGQLYDKVLDWAVNMDWRRKTEMIR